MYPISMVNFCMVVSSKAKKSEFLSSSCSQFIYLHNVGEKDHKVYKRRQDAWLARMRRPSPFVYLMILLT